MSHRRMLEVTNLTKVFFTEDVETHALSDIDLAIERGEFVAITGPSGCGKSTLLAILGLMEASTKGSYLIDSNDVTNLSLTKRAHARNEFIGFVFQNFNLIGDVNVLDNVALPLLYRGISVRERRAKAAEALRRVDMSNRAGHYPAQLSGGQQQRVAIARALVGEPAVLLADEPTGNLDSINSEAVMDLISEVHASGTTVCMVTHDLQYANAANRIVNLLDGRIVTSSRGRGSEDHGDSET